jgi:serine/threonine protein kinase
MSHIAEAATQQCDDLVERVERFLQTWDQGHEPPLGPFLPEQPPAYRRYALSELIKVDLEQRLARGISRRLEHYAREFPELLEANGEPPVDLIYEEYHLRRTAGQAANPRDYYDRFPKSANALRRLMGTDNLTTSTQLVAARQIKSFAAGQRLDDFDLIVEVGKGAFGSVFLARQVSMQRMVALKVSADKGTEPQTLAQLDHPNIIRVFDQRRLPEQSVKLMYMQFAPGGTLQEVVKQVRETKLDARSGAILSATVTAAVEKSGAIVGEDAVWKRRLANATWPETVCRLGIQLAYALDYAHKQGILHRDVKPANVLLGADGSPKLADFNISFCSQLDGASPAAYFGGSVAYMSPEQLEACNPNHDRKPDELDGRSDLYALAVMLWELLYGERPFADEEGAGGWLGMLDGMTQRRRTEQPHAPPGTRDPVALRVEHVLRKTLSPDPAGRPADGAALARELTLCLNPHAWDLVNDLKSGWRDWARRHPLIALFPVNLPPFVLAGYLNYWYNEKHLVGKLDSLKDAKMIDAFWDLVPFVNGVLYPIGIALVLSFAIPAARALARLAKGEELDTTVLRKARQRAITLGHGVAVVGMALWLIAGVAFPIGIRVLAGRCPLDVALKFIVSMFACGIISCCLPFLATTWLSVRVFFPSLLANSTPEPREQRQLMNLSRFAGIYLFFSPVAPLIAVLLVLASGTMEEIRRPIAVLIGTSIVGFLFAYLVWQRIRADLAALAVVTRPPDRIGTTTDSVDSFLA